MYFFDVYEYIADCNTFDTAVNHLKELYIKPPNEVFVQHLLATYGQKEEENIHEYVQRLKLLAKECNFKSVDVVQNRDGCVRDAFITGLRPNIILQWLLENKILHLNIAIDQARVLPCSSEKFRSIHIHSYTNCRCSFSGKYQYQCPVNGYH